MASLQMCGDGCALVTVARWLTVLQWWLVKLGVMVSAAVLVQVYSSINGSRF